MSAEFRGVPEEIHGVVAPHRLCYQGLAGGTTGTELTSGSESDGDSIKQTERDGRVARDTARTLTSLARGKLHHMFSMNGATE